MLSSLFKSKLPYHNLLQIPFTTWATLVVYGNGLANSKSAILLISIFILLRFNVRFFCLELFNECMGMIKDACHLDRV